MPLACKDSSVRPDQPVLLGQPEYKGLWDPLARPAPLVQPAFRALSARLVQPVLLVPPVRKAQLDLLVPLAPQALPAPRVQLVP